MKTRIKNLFLLPTLIAGLSLMLAGRTAAQTFTTLHSFAGSEGGALFAGLILSGNALYGTARSGGISGNGSVFAVNTDGTGFTNLYLFTGGTGGFSPLAGVILSGNTLYGTANQGGSAGNGAVFAVNTNGTGFTNLHSFAEVSGPATNSDGAFPVAGLILSGNTLYGTARNSGGSGKGTVFALNTDGTGFTTLHSFTALNNFTNSDGANPEAGLILSGNMLYGTATLGGSSGHGTIFAVNTNGTGFTNLHNFTDFGDGRLPSAGLVLSGNTLYGTAKGGGDAGKGTVFAVNTDGTGFTTLHSFTDTPGPDFTNSDGVLPSAGLVLSGNTLYGTASQGGSSAKGTVFAINTNGTGFTTLHIFTATSGPNFTNSDGANPAAGLILSGDTFYGTARLGGSSGVGTVFSLSLGPVSPPHLTIRLTATNTVAVSWPSPSTDFSLQQNTNDIATVNWSNVTATIQDDGTNRSLIVNPPTGNRFYRLFKP